jgi:hypothetical protein
MRGLKQPADGRSLSNDRATFSILNQSRPGLASEAYSQDTC